MARKFTETAIPLCGGEYYFKRCSNETLKVFDAKIEEEMRTFTPTQKEAEKLTNDIEMLEERIRNMNRKIDLIEQKEEPTDKELDTCIRLLDKQEKLYDQLEDLRVKEEAFNEEHRDIVEEFNDKVNSIIAEKIETMLEGITKEEFLSNYDSIDMRIATNISKYYELCMLGEKESKIQKEIKNDSNEYNERIKQFRR